MIYLVDILILVYVVKLIWIAIELRKRRGIAIQIKKNTILDWLFPVIPFGLMYIDSDKTIGLDKILCIILIILLAFFNLLYIPWLVKKYRK